MQSFKAEADFSLYFSSGPMPTSRERRVQEKQTQRPPSDRGKDKHSEQMRTRPASLLGQHHTNVSQWLLLLQLLGGGSKRQTRAGASFKRRLCVEQEGVMGECQEHSLLFWSSQQTDKNPVTKTKGHYQAIALYLFPKLM